MSPSLTSKANSFPKIQVRNVTGKTLTLVCVDYKSIAPEQTGFLNVRRNLFSLYPPNLPSRGSRVEATPASEGIGSVQIKPFSICTTHVRSPSWGDQEDASLTFELEGEQYQMKCSAIAQPAQISHPLQREVSFKLSSLYFPDRYFLCIFSTADLDCWMQFLHDATILSALSIPGTHNSATCHNALPSVRCQAVSPRVQLENGIRFLDVRVQVESARSPKLTLVHGVFGVALSATKYFRNLEAEVIRFLQDHPSETVIVCLKREGLGPATDHDLSRAMFQHYTSDPHSPTDRFWYTDPSIPCLGDCRGKIVLMRRFKLSADEERLHDGRGYGINAESWTNNTPFDMRPFVCVQDFFGVLEPSEVPKKIGYVLDQLRRTSDIVQDAFSFQPFYLNFLSGSNFWRSNCWPERIAAKVNTVIVEHLCIKHHVNETGTGEAGGNGGTGIVLCDYVGLAGYWDLVRCIIACNTRMIVKMATPEFDAVIRNDGQVTAVKDNFVGQTSQAGVM